MVESFDRLPGLVLNGIEMSYQIEIINFQGAFAGRNSMS